MDRRGVIPVMDRRQFVKLSAGGVLGLFVRTDLGNSVRVLAQAVPGGTVDPVGLPKFMTAMLVPPQMPRAAILRRGGQLVDYYEIATRQFPQQILPAGFPVTTVWGYGPAKALSPRAPMIFNAPSLTIEANWNRPVMVKWINDLKDSAGNFLPHLLPVDPTLHWANPPGGAAGRDTRPTFASTPARYNGPVPQVTHVHGAVGVGDESDGYAEAWYLPDAGNIPALYAREGTWYEFFKNSAAVRFGADWGAGSSTFRYPNTGRASTEWYHDHTLGMTRVNVYAGPAGFFILRGGPNGDLQVRDSRTGRFALLPGPAPSEVDQIAPGRRHHEIPIAIQDRSFNADGSLFYPDTRAFFDDIAGPYVPSTDVSPIWNPEFFGDTIMVNGATWPYLDVEQRRYRFRFLDGCTARFLILDFTGIPGAAVWQIGNEGGFLAAPVDITGGQSGRVLIGPAERADVIVDFTNVPLGNYVLGNAGPDEPFSGGVPGVDFPVADPQTTGRVMQFRVTRRVGADVSTPPQYLKLPHVQPLPTATLTRPLALVEETSESFEDAPTAALLGTITGDPNTTAGTIVKRVWGEPVTENPAIGATEIWELYNTTVDAHPVHIHEDLFELVNRQRITVDGETGQVRVSPGSTPVGPHPGETGFKDTVIAYPGEVTRIRAKFSRSGQYVWHCHIVEHEDNEMMRPYRIGPLQPGQPEPH